MSINHIITADVERQIARLSERINNASREDLEGILDDVRSLLSHMPGNTLDPHTHHLLRKLQEIQQRAVELYALYHAQSHAPVASGASEEGLSFSLNDVLFLASAPLELAVSPFFSSFTRGLFESLNPFWEYLVQQRNPTGQLSFDANGQPALTQVMGHHLRADICTVQYHALPPETQQKIHDGLVMHSNGASAAQVQGIGRLHTALDRLEAASTAAVYTSDNDAAAHEVHITRIRNRFDIVRIAAHALQAHTATSSGAAAARQRLAHALQAHILPKNSENEVILVPVAVQAPACDPCMNFSWGPHTIFSPGFTPTQIPAAIVSSIFDQ